MYYPLHFFPPRCFREGEGLRFFDLVRTGQAATYINGFVTGKHELFPIPQVEIDLAGGNWSQNPGY